VFLVAAASASALTWGLNNGTRAYEASAVDWDAMKELGITQYHMELNWNRKVHPEPGFEEWAAYDKVFTLAAERNISILPLIYGKAESTYSSANEHRFLTEAEYGQGSPWETWINEVVERYGINGVFWEKHPALPYKPVKVWEVWNEPNLKPNNPLLCKKEKEKEICEEKVQPENYARFLKQTNLLIQKAQNKRGAGAEVLLGGLYSRGGMSVPEFLEKVHNVPESGNSFSGLSLHPYSFRDGPPVVTIYVNSARSNLTYFFGAGKSLWVTELGWNRTPWEDPNHPGVSEDQQAEFLSTSFNWLRNESANLNLQYVAWFDYRDISGSSWDFHAGLLEESGYRRPAWCTYEDIIQVNFCNPYPPNWLNGNLGGYTTSDPTIASWESGRLDVFARGGDSRLWHKSYSATKWSTWEPLGGAYASSYPDPDAVSWGPNRIDLVFLNGTTVEHYYWTGSAWGSDNLEGYLTSAPTISSWESGRLDVFARAWDNRLWRRWFTPSTGWSAWEPLGGAYTSAYPDPDAVSWGPNRIDLVFLNGTTVEHYYWTGSAWGSDNLQGWACSAPTIASKDVGQLEVFVRGCAAPNGLWRNVFTPTSGWSGWLPLYGKLASSPDAVSWGPNRTDVVAQGYLGNQSLMWAWLNQ